MVIVGIDPGLDGGLAWLSGNGAGAIPMPTVAGKRRVLDLVSVRGFLGRIGPDLVVLEEVSAAPVQGRRQGTASMFAFGRGFGQIEGLLAGLAVSYVLVRPQTWKAVVLKGTAKDKAAAIGWASRRFPQVSLMASDRCRTPHDGMSEALAIAEYGRRISREAVSA